MEVILGLLFLFVMICLPFLLLLGLYYACLFGVLGFLSWIFDPPKKPESSYDPRKYESTWTVRDAIRYGYITSLRDSLKNGADPNQCDEDGVPAVLYAAIWNRLDSLRVLLDAGADVNIKNQAGKTPLLMLVAREHSVVMLLARVAQPKGGVPALQLLIEAGADLDARNEAGQTALFLAVMKEHTEAVRVLIEAGADINAMTPEGETPLDAAKRPDIVRLLETAGGF